MNKILLTIVIVFAIVGGIVLVSRVSNDSSTGPTISTSAGEEKEAPDQTSSQEKTSTQAISQYLDYSADQVAQTVGTRVLFFYAPWCPQCRKLEASIQAGSIPAGVTIFKVDYDSNQELRKKYGITIQTTLVRLDAEGNFAKKYTAYDSPSLESVVMNLL